MATATDRKSVVAPEIINEIARKHGMGAGGLKEALAELKSSEDLEKQTGQVQEACREALTREGERRGEERREEIGEQRERYSREFHSVVCIAKIHAPLPDEILDGYHPVTVRLPSGVEETTTFSTLAPLKDVEIEISASTPEVYELAAVLEAGIAALEERNDSRLSGEESAEFSRSARQNLLNEVGT